MASEFRPGHPVTFWLVIVALVYGIYAGGMAAVHRDDCKNLGVPDQHWSAWPPGWVCGTR